MRPALTENLASCTLVQNDCVTTGSTTNVFDALKAQNCAAAIWQRQTLPDFQNWIDRLPKYQLPEGRLILRPASVLDAVHNLCEIAKMPASPERGMFINDIACLADLFSTLMKAKYLRIRLDVVSDNGCPKFHKDTIVARLVCTYRGPGTEYGISTDGMEPKTVSRVATGSPILMRGLLWPEAPESGFLHRSPPIEQTDETRLVLVLDPVFDPDEEF